VTDNPPVSAQPSKPKRRLRKPPKSRNPDAAVTLVVRADGSFVPSTEASKQICRTRKLYTGIEVIAYLYEVRSLEQWHKAHGFGAALVEHVEDFHGLNAHSALKKIQTDGNIGCETETFDLGTLGKVTRSVAKSLAWYEMDEGEFQEIYGRMLEYVRQRYWPSLDESGMLALQKLLGVGS
jgi:hypothetical protein